MKSANKNKKTTAIQCVWNAEKVFEWALLRRKRWTPNIYKCYKTDPTKAVCLMWMIDVLGMCSCQLCDDEVWADHLSGDVLDGICGDLNSHEVFCVLASSINNEINRIASNETRQKSAFRGELEAVYYKFIQFHMDIGIDKMSESHEGYRDCSGMNAVLVKHCGFAKEIITQKPKERVSCFDDFEYIFDVECGADIDSIDLAMNFDWRGEYQATIDLGYKYWSIVVNDYQKINSTVWQYIPFDDEEAAYIKELPNWLKSQWRHINRPEPRQPATRKNNKSLYLIKCERTGHYKIGIGKNPTQRESTLQNEKPDLKMVGSWVNLGQHEKHWHAHFAQQRMRGEWFKLTPAQVRFFCHACAKGYGPPQQTLTKAAT